jgi:hypothetical protein
MDDNVRAEAYWPCFQEIAAGSRRTGATELRERRVTPPK